MEPHAKRIDETLLTECDVDTFRAGGPGGQHRNKTESAVRLTHRPTGTVVTARNSRSQHRNRQQALHQLHTLLEKLAQPEKLRVPTSTPRMAKMKRLEDKRRRSDRKKDRKEPGLDD